MSKFDELKKLAEAASPGPWTYEVNDDVYSVTYAYNDAAYSIENVKIDLFCDEPHEASVPHSSDAQYIAAANPAVILELLAILAQLVAALSVASFHVPGKNKEEKIMIRAAFAAAGEKP